MAVIDLETRLTKDWDSYNSNLKSSDSLIFISPHNYNIEDGPASLDLTVGNRFFFHDRGQHYTITDDGIYIEPFNSLLIETEQKVCLPLNIFGIVIGKGHQIFQGTFISSGKINPGFNGKLNIGLYNGSRKRIHIKSGHPLCSCVFFQMESNMNSPLKNYDANRQINKVYLTRTQKLFNAYKGNMQLVTHIIAIIAFLVALFVGLTNRNSIFSAIESDSKSGKIDKK
ncbi:dCTP deaminase domain-containing protein [Fibrella aestuarina]|uniref:dCTP deaminase domain-containing protein n=1 Tax=Fibrella aestuarina TaxID=651143 RepID=UPI00059C814F|nr:hypothetical protein [Fibrella aestuarina]